jgi:hypothetical protein
MQIKIKLKSFDQTFFNKLSEKWAIDVDKYDNYIDKLN